MFKLCCIFLLLISRGDMQNEYPDYLDEFFDDNSIEPIVTELETPGQQNTTDLQMILPSVQNLTAVDEIEMILPSVHNLTIVDEIDVKNATMTDEIELEISVLNATNPEAAQTSMIDEKTAVMMAETDIEHSK